MEFRGIDKTWILHKINFLNKILCSSKITFCWKFEQNEVISIDTSINCLKISCWVVFCRYFALNFMKNIAFQHICSQNLLCTRRSWSDDLFWSSCSSKKILKKALVVSQVVNLVLRTLHHPCTQRVHWFSQQLLMP